MIMNLSQLKRHMKDCPKFEITGHCRPELIGQIRKVTLANTQGFYSVVDGEPNHKISRANNGLGSVLWWSNAPFWSFHDGKCALYTSDVEHIGRNLIMEFRIFEEVE